jgi:hypothetical protein
VRFCISSRDARDITLVDRARASASAAFCAASFSFRSASALSFLRIALAYSLSKTAPPSRVAAADAVDNFASRSFRSSSRLAASLSSKLFSRLCFPGPPPKTYFVYALLPARRSESSPATRRARSAPALAGLFLPNTISVRSKTCSAELWNCLDFSYLSSGGRVELVAGRRAASQVADAGRRAAAAASASSLRRSASALSARALAFARASFALSAALASSVSVEVIAGFAVTGRPWRAARSRRRDLSLACSSFTARGRAIVAEKPLAWQKSRATCVGSSRSAISMRSNRPPPKSTSTAAMAFLSGEGEGAFGSEGARGRGRVRARGDGEFPESGRDGGGRASNATSQTTGAGDARRARDPPRPTPGTTAGKKRQVTGTHLVCLNVPIAVERGVALPILACQVLELGRISGPRISRTPTRVRARSLLRATTSTMHSPAPTRAWPATVRPVRSK